MLVRFLGAVFLIVIVFGIVAYAQGWLVFESEQGTTNVKVKTEEIKDATKDAVEKGGNLIEEAGENLKQSTDSDNASDKPSEKMNIPDKE